MKVQNVDRMYSNETGKKTCDCYVTWENGDVDLIKNFPNYPDGCDVVLVNGKYYLEDIDRSAYEYDDEAEMVLSRYRENADFFYKVCDVISYETYEKVTKDIKNIAKLFKDNPYILCEKEDENGEVYANFSKLDRLVNIRSFDMRLKELRLAAREVLDRNESEGHTWIPYEEFASKFHYLLESTGHPLICGDPSAILNFFGEFYVDTPLTKDSRVAKAQTRRNEIYIEKKVRAYADNDGLFRNYVPPTTMTGLTDEQRDAIKGAILGKGRFSILTGGPGTGKTTVISQIVDGMAMAYPNIQIRLLAPTGKASKRIEEQMGGREVDVSTIHKFLGYGREFISKEEREEMKKSGLVVIDESSMIDIEIFVQLLEELDMSKTKIVLVGDENQLPSIGAGNILHDLIEMGVPTFRLTKNHRNSGLIDTNAKKIINGEINLGEDNYFKIVSFNARYGWLYAGVDKENDAIIVPYHDESKLGSVPSINKIAQDRRRISIVPSKARYNIGDAVICLNNNYGAGYLNGDVGRYQGKNGDTHEVLLSSGKTVFVLDSDLELGYAITIHKSQGSEYPILSISIPEYSSFVTRKMLYTAVTRAKEKVVIYARRPVIDRIILNNKDEQRRTFLGHALT